jgi:hypothetical protein
LPLPSFCSHFLSFPCLGPSIPSHTSCLEWQMA